MNPIGSRRSKRAPQPKKKRRSRLGVYFLVALFIAMLMVGFKLADSMFEPVTAKPSLGEDEPEPIKTDKNGPINILILGIDERDHEPVRSDTIILASLFPDTREVKLLSIPRDTRVTIPGRKNPDKINHAYAFGGPDLTRKSVEEFLGIPVHNYVTTNFKGFINIIDILGGVTYNVEQRMYYPDEDIDLHPGLQKLNGYDSLAYVRYRSDGLGDIGRVNRQQKFIKALADNAVSINTIWKIPDLIKEINTHVKTDLSTKDILYLGTRFATISPSDLESQMVPGTPRDIGSINYWIADQKKLDQILKEMKILP